MKINSIPPLKVAPFWRNNKNNTKEHQIPCSLYVVFVWGEWNGMNGIKGIKEVEKGWVVKKLSGCKFFLMKNCEENGMMGNEAFLLNIGGLSSSLVCGMECREK